MYRETLTGQWKNLSGDFAQEYDRLLAKGEAPGCFAGWYETRIHRWQSVAYPEGIILEQTQRSLTEKQSAQAVSQTDETETPTAVDEPSASEEQPDSVERASVNPAAFLGDLLDAMKAFTFEPVAAQPQRPVWHAYAAGLAGGVISAGLLALFDWPTWRWILSGVVVCVVISLGFLRTIQTEREREQKRIKDDYVKQLEDYLSELTAVCDRYEVDA